MRIEDDRFYIGDKLIPWAKEIFNSTTDLRGEVYRHRGVHLMFETGYTLSIQWGSLNYCDNRMTFDLDKEWQEDCPTAEIALWDKDERWHHWPNDMVLGWVTEDVLLEIIDLLAKGKWEMIYEEIDNEL